MTVEWFCPPCHVCGEGSTLSVPIEGIMRWQEGVLIQNALPMLNADEREMLISGTHPKCWDMLWGEEE